jgi:hypothetical protein
MFQIAHADVLRKNFHNVNRMRGKYNYYGIKGIDMQDSRYVQQSNLDRWDTERQVSEPKRVTSCNKFTTGHLFVLDLSGREILWEGSDCPKPS